MSVKSDEWIRRMAEEHELIVPFEPDQVRKGISFGVSSYGYDISLSNDFKLPRSRDVKEIDPKKHSDDLFEAITADSLLIPAGSYLLGRTREYFKIPRDVLTICTGKSSYARCGLIVNVTPFEPEWEGYATLALVNGSGLPLRVYAGEGIAQLLFLSAESECLVSYADKKGKYQGQKTITLSKSD
ncbi:MAG: dCTP deaminase [candidate division Zixibacteria bacterium]